MRKATLFLLLLLFGYSGASGQNDLLPDDRLRFHLSVGQYPATLLLPGFSTINPGINTGLEIQWNKSPRHQ